MEELKKEVIELLKKLIETPSISRDESKTADLIEQFLTTKGFFPQRSGNNVWVSHSNGQSLPTILLNSHHDTVKPNPKWVSDPFQAKLEGDTLTGLGSNDAGGPLMALLATFIHLTQTEQAYNLIFAATAEEEVSGKNGVESILTELGEIRLGIVGEPTQSQMAIAEKGLMVIDGEAIGKAGHAARNEGTNSIYLAMEDIAWFKNYRFPKISEVLGEIKMSVTQIEAGSQHNVVPASCKFVVDVRTTETYSNQEVFEIIKENVKSEVKARSFRLNSSGISLDHPIVKKGTELGLSYYGSPTLSDQALMPFTTIKMGPGDSARSHTAEEYILLSEIKSGIDWYVKLLDGLELG
ncbi:M20 family metallo-hydrolase [Flammeovirgaceae bacterium SG7u.111]|nr:M20 family metallo-hydrolase [Flammeovirgaceae bacterium SG7u.132]WPO37711.1 M20 family metallo-hydrolase [Flammeovirgaceae bacterium SG7u.111]